MRGIVKCLMIFLTGSGIAITAHAQKEKIMPIGDTIHIKNIVVYGKPIDHQKRCVHWHSALDIIAIKFKCCGKYYPCYSCHEETANHPAIVWPASEFNEKAILCGVCGHELTINEYMQCRNTCPDCASAFNPGCANHYYLYFETEKQRADREP
jgi:uncharacterized CHY-type Zn-finger protein